MRKSLEMRMNFILVAVLFFSTKLFSQQQPITEYAQKRWDMLYFVDNGSIHVFTSIRADYSIVKGKLLLQLVNAGSGTNLVITTTYSAMFCPFRVKTLFEEYPDIYSLEIVGIEVIKKRDTFGNISSQKEKKVISLEITRERVEKVNWDYLVTEFLGRENILGYTLNSICEPLENKDDEFFSFVKKLPTKTKRW